LYATRFDNNPYFRNRRLLDWIGYGMGFWSTLQHRDGSFDEAYPFERSLAATAFTSFYIAEALEFVGKDLPQGILARLQQTMTRSGKWLIKNDETHGLLSNHLSAAAAALYHVYRLTGDDTFKRRSLYFLEKITARQSREGWYEEYGGADPGYQTHGSFYLTRYLQLSQNEELAHSLSRSMTFLAHFVHPDGSLGGEYGSRNTQTYYPAAFEMFAIHHSAAAWIAEAMRPSVLSGAAAGLRSVDAYNYFPFLNNLVFAHLACANENGVTASPQEPSSQPGLVCFPEAGIVRVRRERYDAYVGTAKGGVIKVFDRRLRKLVYSDCGYIGRLHGGQLFSSQYQERSRLIKVEPDRVEVDGVFYEISRPTMKPFTFVLFRMFTLSFGRLGPLGRWLKSRLVKVLIYRKRALNIRFKRTVEFSKLSVSVCDNISGPDGERVENLRWGEVFTTIHMGSSRYFVNNELEEPLIRHREMPHDVDVEQLSSGVELGRVVTFHQENA
jgi:hypothetical protein